MPNSAEIAQRIWELFTQPTPPMREYFLNNLQVPPLSGLPAGAEPIKDFSPFQLTHQKRINLIKDQMDHILSNGLTEEEGLENTLDFFESLLGKENPDLLFYALQLFLIHYKGNIEFSIPSLIVREPELVTPSQVPGQVPFAIALGSEEETKLDWFRESPSINEHHQHWHIVYNPSRRIDRQGEMFFYMHQQMIARYDVERISENIDRVKPFDDFSQPIEVGYAPGPDERLSRFIRSSRQPRVSIQRVDAREQERYLSAVIRNIDDGQYDPADNNLSEETKVINKLGSTLEPNAHTDAEEAKEFYGYHSLGHMIIAGINDGVMGSTTTAVRDVVFWEWHKGIDDLYFRLQERMQPYDFSIDAPPVLLRKGVDNEGDHYSSDIILISGNNLPEEAIGKEIGNLAFGGVNWEEDFEVGRFAYQDSDGNNQTIETTNTLYTSFKQGTIRYRSLSSGQPVQYSYRYLAHEPFAYFLRVENTSLEQKQVTVRIFIVPETVAEDRRMWIEMDKFLQELPPRSKTVVYRKDTESSVIRKPHVADPSVDHTVFNPANIRQNNFQCDCGWPYQMLVPKGQRAGDGMPFKLMVMVSDAAIDLMEGENNCGSLSFCAARTNSYPDKRPLGYPFNRPFNGGANSILNTIRSLDNMASRNIFIKHQ